MNSTSIKAIMFMFLTTCLSAMAFSQSALRTTGYLSPGINSPSANFGYSKGVENMSINTFGTGVSGGMIIYFNNEESDVPQRTNIGLDVAFCEIMINNNIVAAEPIFDEYSDSYEFSEHELKSTIVSIKIGPVLSIVPHTKYMVDLYAQGAVGLSDFSYYDNFTNSFKGSAGMTPQYRVSGGMRVGYQYLFLNVEYNWGRPNIKTVDSNTGSIRSFNINQSFLRIGFTFKFSAFE